MVDGPRAVLVAVVRGCEGPIQMLSPCALAPGTSPQQWAQPHAGVFDKALGESEHPSGTCNYRAQDISQLSRIYLDVHLLNFKESRLAVTELEVQQGLYMHGGDLPQCRSWGCI